MSRLGQATDVGQEKSPLRLRQRNGLGQPLRTAGDVLADVGECSMATGVRKCEGASWRKKI
jgi:hypothetical protein